MATTQAQRTVLHSKLVELMDQEAADILIDQLPPSGWEQMATKDDLANTEQRLQAALQTATADTNIKSAETNAAMEAGFAELRAAIATGLAEINSALAETNAAMETGFAEAAKERAAIVKTQARQLYVIFAGMVAMITPIWIALFLGAGT